MIPTALSTVSTSEEKLNENGLRGLFEFFKRCYEIHLLSLNDYEWILNEYFTKDIAVSIAADAFSHLAILFHELNDPKHEVYLAKITDCNSKKDKLILLWLSSALEQTETHKRALLLCDKLGPKFFDKLLVENPKQYTGTTLQLVEAANGEKYCLGYLSFFSCLKKQAMSLKAKVKKKWRKLVQLTWKPSVHLD